MNIAFFTDSFTPEVNGVVTSLLSFTAEFEKRGHQVFVFAPNDKMRPEHLVATKTRRFPSILVFGKQVRLSLPMMRAKTIAKLNLDVIHIHTPGTLGMAGIRIGKKLGIPLVFTYHTRVERYARYYLHLPAWMEKGTAFLASKLYNKNDAIIAPANGLKTELQKYTKAPIYVIPTGLDLNATQKFDNPRAQEILRQHGLKSTDELLITTSRLGKEKNIKFIIDAFNKIKSACSNSKLLIAGGGPQKAELEQYVRAQGLDNEIIFLGFLKQAELFALYRLAKIFLFASHTETQGLVILEAMGAGLPVVALCAPGVEDFLAGNRGGFMTGNDQNEFADKITTLLQNKQIWETKKQEAVEQAQNFSIEKMADKTLALYGELIKQKTICKKEQ